MSIMEIEKELEACKIGGHSYLANTFQENRNKKEKERCSRCGGEHFDLTCIYFKNNVNKSSKNN